MLRSVNLTKRYEDGRLALDAFNLKVDPGEIYCLLGANGAGKTTAINLFGGAPNSANPTARAQALRQVAEHPSLNTLESNRAFVLAEFFGYLRRNPNDAPDTDYTGYEFWLNKLNQFNGNFINAEMVKAFISSTEYRQRVGP